MAGKGTPKGEIRNPNGRPRGTKNKVTLERERLALEAMRSASKRKAMGEMLAREVLAWGMMRFYDVAEAAWANQDEARAKELTILAGDFAFKLAPYESPRLMSVQHHQADPYAEMTDMQLWSELRARAHALGLVMPEMPKLIDAVVESENVTAA